MPRSQGLAPNGPNHPALPPIRKARGAWECRVCHYKPNLDKVSKYCINCGRDYWGNPGIIPQGLGRVTTIEGDAALPGSVDATAMPAVVEGSGST